jgi:RNA polymerase sigma-70 factor (ECF subfamily)
MADPAPGAEHGLPTTRDAPRDPLGEALDRLPDEDRRILLWRYREERSFEEIGRLLNCSPQAARRLWVEAVERLQQEMAAPP